MHLKHFFSSGPIRLAIRRMESREQDHQDDVREIIVDVNEKQTLLSLRISEDRDVGLLLNLK